MELIYHFGDLNDTGKTANETLARRKRQQSNDTEEVYIYIIKSYLCKGAILKKREHFLYGILQRR